MRATSSACGGGGPQPVTLMVLFVQAKSCKTAAAGRLPEGRVAVVTQAFGLIHIHSLVMNPPGICESLPRATLENRIMSLLLNITVFMLTITFFFSTVNCNAKEKTLLNKARGE